MRSRPVRMSLAPHSQLFTPSPIHRAQPSSFGKGKKGEEDEGTKVAANKSDYVRSNRYAPPSTVSPATPSSPIVETGGDDDANEEREGERVAKGKQMESAPAYAPADGMSAFEVVSRCGHILDDRSALCVGCCRVN